jgi:hypothetical protein
MFKTITAVLAAALVLVPAAAAQSKGKPAGTTTVPVGAAKTVEALVARYTQLAGSEANARSLVSGVRDGTTITLTATVTEQIQVPVETQVTETVMVPVQIPAPPPAPPGTFITVMQPRTVTRTVTTFRIETVSRAETTTIEPPTGKMGLGEVDIALAFTEAQVTELGLASPTPGQIKAALVGGEVQYGDATPKASKLLPGILALRARNMGWGQIAIQLGYKLQ